MLTEGETVRSERRSCVASRRRMQAGHELIFDQAGPNAASEFKREISIVNSRGIRLRGASNALLHWGSTADQPHSTVTLALTLATVAHATTSCAKMVGALWPTSAAGASAAKGSWLRLSLSCSRHRLFQSRQVGSPAARWREKTYMILSMKMLEGIGMSVA